VIRERKLDWKSGRDAREKQERHMVALLKMPNRFAAPKKAAAERRAFPRKETHVRIEGKRLDHTLDACKQPHVSLAMRDLSVGGLSAISDTPMQAGERVTVFFPPQGMMRGWDAYGRVVRCDPSSFGYRVALEFDTLPAA
jgi:hypothetical protein